MDSTPACIESRAPSPMCVGLTCWLWQRSRRGVIRQIAQATGVTLRLTHRIRGLHREVECEVSGPNVDRFIREFARRC